MWSKQITNDNNSLHQFFKTKIQKYLHITEPELSLLRLMIRMIGGRAMKVENIQNKFPNINRLNKDDQLVLLMEEYGDMVIRLAYTYVKQKQMAEDIAQEVFISCYKHLNLFQKNSSYKTWIYRITVNKCKDIVRSWSFKNIYYKDIIRSRIKSESKSLENKLISWEENQFIFQKVLSLPIKLREVIILHYYEDLSINEIAELLCFSPNTVKTRLHRARKQLKSLFEGGKYL